MNKTKIEWCDATWNPVTGCRHGCDYCYARKLAKRFSYDGQERDASMELQSKWLHDSAALKSGVGNTVLEYPVNLTDGRVVPYPFDFAPTFHRYRLNELAHMAKPRNIFVCSMADLFGSWVSEEWIKAVFEACKQAPQHRYLFLTKNSNRYIDLDNKRILPWSENFWFGTTVTRPTDEFTWFEGRKYHWFLSIEPMLERFGPISGMEHLPEWIIIGAETGNRKDKVVPKKEWVDDIVDFCDRYNIPLFMKDSLVPIMGEENMRREFPWEKAGDSNE